MFLTSFSYSIDACEYPMNSIILYENSVYYNLDKNIHGFEFKVDGAKNFHIKGGDVELLKKSVFSRYGKVISTH